MNIAILLYDRLTALDAIGPYEVLSRIPGCKVTFVAEQPGLKRTDTGSLGLMADVSIDELTEPEIVLVPGGPGSRDLMQEGPVHQWLRQVHQNSTWTTSVCTGSLILAAAGLLDQKSATCHWMVIDELSALGAKPVRQRVVFDGKIVTAAGVSAGIDMALELVQRMFGAELSQAIQLGIEYDPKPPHAAGSPDSAPSEIVQAVREYAGSTELAN